MTLLMKNKNKGFTLVETLVALSAFSIIVIVMAAIAFSIVQSQRRAFALQVAQEASRHILESMSKEVRMSLVDSGDSGGIPMAVLEIYNAREENINYEFYNNNLYRYPDGESRGPAYQLNPGDLEISGGFIIRKFDFPYRTTVTIATQIKSSGAKPEQQTQAYLQSTISQRSFEK